MSSNRDSYDSNSNTSLNGQPQPPLPLAASPPPGLHSKHHQPQNPPPIPKMPKDRKELPRSDPESNSSKRAEENSPSRVIEYIAISLSWLMTVVFFPFVVCTCYKVVREYERAVIFRMGRLRAGMAKGPGTLFILPCVDSCYVLDLRTVTFDVPPQEILTHDAVTVAVDAVVYYRVYNPTVAVANVEDYNRSTRLLASTTLRNVLGTKALSEILTDRESIAHTMQASLDEATDPWGVKVERVEIKDVRLPQQLQRTMAAEAEATREAKAKIIAAEGEKKASEALRDASAILGQSPGAIQLRYLQTLSSIAAEKNSTIIFPLPMELIRPFCDDL